MNAIVALVLAAAAATSPTATPAKATAKLATAKAVTISGKMDASTPAIAADGNGKLHVAWSELSGKSPDVYYSSSKDGVTWSAPVDISNTPGASSDPDIAIGPKGQIVVVWADTTSGNDSPDIFATTSMDGKKWSVPLDISNSPGKSSNAAVCLTPSGDIHVIWVDTTADITAPDIFHSVSKDGGQTFSKSDDISNSPNVSADPAIACGPKGEVYATYTDIEPTGKDRDIWLTSTTDGKTWSKPADISNTPGLSSNPDIAADPKGNVYAVWEDTTSGQDSPDIFLAVSHDGAKTWDPLADVSKTPGKSTDPAVDVDKDGNVAVVWCDTARDETAPDVWVTRSANGGKSFTDAEDLSNTPGISSLPDVIISNGKIYSVWEEMEKGHKKIKVISSPVKHNS
jgi:BNR repeat-like domain